MSQHDFNIANQSFPATRTDLNNALQALASNSSGDAEPSTTFANQWWYETDTNTLKLRNEANNAWLSFATVDQSTAAWTLAHDVTVSNGLTVSGAFTSLGIDDNATSTAITIDSSENVLVGTTSGSSPITMQTRSGEYYQTGFQLNSTNADFSGALLDMRATSGTVSTANGRFLRFYSDNGSTERFHVKGSGEIYTASGILLGGTAAANKLDDYEEGTFTVSFTGATITPGNPTAIYTKIGSTVFWSWYSSGSTITGASGDAILSGLPFVVRNVQGAYSPFSTTHNTFFGGSATVGISGYHQKNGSNIIFITTGTTASSTYVNGTGKDLMICGTYLTDA